MGVLSGKDIFNSKWITAQITDASNRLWYVPIKNPIGDYFLTELNGQVYCFLIDGSKVKTYRHTLVKSFRILQYDTNHYRPIDPAMNTELKNVIEQNQLPKINQMLFNILKLLGKREKANKNPPHELKDLVDELSQHESEYSDEVRSIINFLTHLNIDQIITPVRPVTDFIEEDLIASDPKFFGAIVNAFQRLDLEHKKVTNTPITGRRGWLKIIGIAMIIGVVAFVAYWLYDTGTFSAGLPDFLNISTGPTIDEIIAGRTPEEMKAAIDRGEVDYNELPRDLQKIIDSVKLPTVTPNQ